MIRRTWLLGLCLVVASAACSTASPVAGVSDVYFTNAESGPGYQRYNAGSPYQLLPPVIEFDRQRDARIKIVIVFSTGSAHSVRAVLNSPNGAKPRPVTWEVPAHTQFGGWTTSSAYWSINPSTATGRYRVDLTIDGTPAGAYSFDVK